MFYPSTYRDPSLRCPVSPPDPAAVRMSLEKAHAALATNEASAEAAGTAEARKALEAHRSALQIYAPTIGALQKAAVALAAAQRADEMSEPDDAVQCRARLVTAEAGLRRARAEHESAAAALATAQAACAKISRRDAARREILKTHLNAAIGAAEDLLDSRELAALKRMAR